MEQTNKRIDRSLIAILVVIAAVIVLAIVAVFASNQEIKAEPGSPEFAIQNYSKAVMDGDQDTALKYLTSSQQENCDPNLDSMNYSTRMTLVSTKITGDSAVVKVRIEISYDNGAFTDSSGTTDSFRLVKESGDWKIQQAPWPLIICYNQGEK
ncbi:MAG: DUF4878 domain-containing protein [Cryobacterium sp.]|nr:DUF4878 domain-containing protein [Cryobacterium sp.]MBX3104646.1 DUF4878 domain-containing protein [Cryobacterium sp.]